MQVSRDPAGTVAAGAPQGPARHAQNRGRPSASRRGRASHGAKRCLCWRGVVTKDSSRTAPPRRYATKAVAPREEQRAMAITYDRARHIEAPRRGPITRLLEDERWLA